MNNAGAGHTGRFHEEPADRLTGDGRPERARGGRPHPPLPPPDGRPRARRDPERGLDVVLPARALPGDLRRDQGLPALVHGGAGGGARGHGREGAGPVPGQHPDRVPEGRGHGGGGLQPHAADERGRGGGQVAARARGRGSGGGARGAATARCWRCSASLPARSCCASPPRCSAPPEAVDPPRAPSTYPGRFVEAGSIHAVRDVSSACGGAGRALASRRPPTPATPSSRPSTARRRRSPGGALLGSPGPLRRPRRAHDGPPGDRERWARSPSTSPWTTAGPACGWSRRPRRCWSARRRRRGKASRWRSRASSTATRRKARRLLRAPRVARALAVRGGGAPPRPAAEPLLSLEDLVYANGKHDGKLVRVRGAYRGPNRHRDLPEATPQGRQRLGPEGRVLRGLGDGEGPPRRGLGPDPRRIRGRRLHGRDRGRPRPPSGGVVRIAAREVSLYLGPEGASRCAAPRAAGAEATPPRVAFTYPVPGETLDARRPMIIQFSKPLDPRSLESRVRVRYGRTAPRWRRCPTTTASAPARWW